ncbi:MAG: ATP-binding protein [Chloroflexota bacterium]
MAANNLDASALTVFQRNEQVDIIRTDVGRLNRLFENIVEMARIETGAIAAEPQWVQPAEIIDTARRQVGHPLASRPVSVDVDERTVVKIDPRLTSTAVAHLLENAAQYSREGTSIEIRAWIEQDALLIGVRDHGPGVPPAELTKVFERFYRGPSAQEHFGTGMGLAITRGLLAAQGGRVWVDNHPSGGAVFTLAVPVMARSVTVMPDGDVT